MFTLRSVVWRCSVLRCVALCVGTWWVTSIVVFLCCAVFPCVFLLCCAFRGAALCPGVWYCALSSCGWVDVRLRHVVLCGAVPCHVVWWRVLWRSVVVCCLVVCRVVLYGCLFVEVGGFPSVALFCGTFRCHVLSSIVLFFWYVGCACLLCGVAPCYIVWCCVLSCCCVALSLCRGVACVVVLCYAVLRWVVCWSVALGTVTHCCVLLLGGWSRGVMFALMCCVVRLFVLVYCVSLAGSLFLAVSRCRVVLCGWYVGCAPLLCYVVPSCCGTLCGVAWLFRCVVVLRVLWCSVASCCVVLCSVVRRSGGCCVFAGDFLRCRVALYGCSLCRGVFVG